MSFETSLVKCDLCAYEWVAVRPKYTEKLECPNCSNITNFENIKNGKRIKKSSCKLGTSEKRQW